MMRVTEVSQEDGKACAQLMAFLKAGSWQLKGSDVDELMRVRKWVSDLALEMAKQLRAAPKPAETAPASSDGGFRVTKMGPLPGAGKSRGKKR